MIVPFDLFICSIQKHVLNERLPTPVSLLGESYGWRSLAGYNLWSNKESDITEQLSSLIKQVACLLSERWHWVWHKVSL